ncbi:MAG: UDP-N-acetylmuramoyl-L-alanyl-D-glutamate--2,6-diaminopimelate ligase [Planctomycetota bacterium]
MQLGELIGGLGVAVLHGDRSAAVTGITDDSRRIEPGWAYVVRHAAGARQGEIGGDNAGYVEQAVAARAGAVTDTREATAAQGLGVQSLAGELAARWYGRPSDAIDVIGVTGTNGKTTVATQTQALLKSAGIGCGLIGTIAVDTGDPGGPAEAALTTPGAVELQALLAAMRDRGLKAAAIEVSSHALEQGRADAVSFAAGVFTNLSGDHLDYHGDMASYGEAKARLLGLIRPGGAAVINVDDAWSASLADRVPGGARAIGCSMRGEADATVAIDSAEAGMRLTLRGGWGEVVADVPLVGEHNAMNVLQAAAAAWAVGERHGMTTDDLTRGLAALPVVPGRLEIVTADGPTAGRIDKPMVIVDYAHTDDALDKALRALRPLADCRGGKLHVVFGCGGDRDRQKRPRMMRVACEFADFITVTSDNPRAEDPVAIINEVMRGAAASDADRVHREVDRSWAIEQQVCGAGDQDVVLIAGKGHETYQLIGDQRLDFDDRDAAAGSLLIRADDIYDVETH